MQNFLKENTLQNWNSLQIIEMNFDKLHETMIWKNDFFHKFILCA